MASEMKHILLDLQAKDEGVAIIKINRPEVLNALNREAMSATLTVKLLYNSLIFVMSSN